MLVQFTVYGKPQGKARARVTTRGGYAHSYTPAKTKTYEDLIRKCFVTHEDAPRIPCKGEIRIVAVAHFEPPKSSSKSLKEKMIHKLIPHMKKPDLDNIAKCICDALNKVAYDDDSQIVFLQISKSYAEVEKLEITVQGDMDHEEL